MRFIESIREQVRWTGLVSGKLQMRNELHLIRKAWHVIMGLMIAGVYMAGLPKSTGVFILGAVLGFTLVMETLRLRIPSLNEKVTRFWSPIMRTCEVNRMSGIPFYVGASLISVLIFPKTIAVLSILFLAIGDPMASLVGIQFGDLGLRFKNGKSLIGSLAGVIACVFLGLIFLTIQKISMPDRLILSIVGGFAGGLAEMLPFEIDDNFTIPMISGLALWFSCILLNLSI